MRMSEKQWKTAQALYLNGESWKAIAEHVGAKETTLRKRAHAEGITKVKKDVESVLPIKQISSDKTIETLSSLVRQKLASDALQTLERVDNYNIAEINDEAKREQVLSSVAKRSAIVFGWEESQNSAQISINLLNAMPDKQAIDV